MKNIFPPRKLAIYGAMLLGFAMLESPMIMIANRIEPTVMGIPFLFIWNLGWWAFLTALFWVAYLTNWGSGRPSASQKKLRG